MNRLTLLVLATVKSGAAAIALVVDEFGGTAGIVTLEDLFAALAPLPPHN